MMEREIPLVPVGAREHDKRPGNLPGRYGLDSTCSRSARNKPGHRESLAGGVSLVRAGSVTAGAELSIVRKSDDMVYSEFRVPRIHRRATRSCVVRRGRSCEATHGQTDPDHDR
jgi:hypothetical protein